MAETTALGVPALNNEGVDSLTHRKIIGAMWRSTGIAVGMGVKGTSTMAYSVGEGMVVTSRGDADGKMEAYWDGGETAAVSANAGSYPRIDAVCLIAHNHKLGDDDNRVHVMVAEGTPAMNPTRPAIPTGATVLSYMRLPAGATTTANATREGEIDYAIHYASGGNVMGSKAQQQRFELTARENSKATYNSMRVSLPTDRMLRMVASVCFSAKGANGALDFSKYTELRIQFRIDGVGYGPIANLNGWGAWQSRQCEVSQRCGRGDHTVDIQVWVGNGQNAIIHGENLLEGLRLDVYDSGPVI